MTGTRNGEIAVLCWEEGHVPKGLVQLESLKGNSTNPGTYPFPVRFCRIEGANVETVLEHPSQNVLRSMINESRRLASEGVRAITTSCGFNAVFQKELKEALSGYPVQVFTSSLLQVPMISMFLGRSEKIGVITAKKPALKEEHLRSAGITPDINIEIFGMDECREWNKIFTAPGDGVDLGKIAAEAVLTAENAAREFPDISVIVLECTDLPPFADAIRDAVKRPVYDFTTLVGFVARSLGLWGVFQDEKEGSHTRRRARIGAVY
jgi:hypothetical protein